MPRLPCGCDPEEGPSRGTRCDTAWALHLARKEAGGASTPEGWRLLGEMCAHFDEQRAEARKPVLHSILCASYTSPALQSRGHRPGPCDCGANTNPQGGKP